MSDLLLALGGAALLIIVLGDVIATVLAPEAHGWLSAPVGRAVWSLVHAGDRLPGRSPFAIGGTLAVLATLAAWFLGLWAGFALLIGAADGAVSTSSSGAAADAGPVLRDLYLAGAALTTLGFGDVVATEESGLIITVLAAGAGLAVVTAAISYVLSVYPLIARKRAAAAWAADLGADLPTRSAALLLRDHERFAGALHSRLNVVDQDLRRFPVLYYFHASRHEEELTVLLRAAYLGAAHLEWTLAAQPGGRELDARPLRRVCERVSEGIATSFAVADAPAPDDEELDRIFERLAAGARDAGVAPPARPPSAELRKFVARGERFLHSFALAHGYRHESLVSPPDRSC